MTNQLRGQRIAVKTGLVTETCCNCGVLFAFTDDFRAQRERDGKTFYCPVGHGQSYTNSDAEKIRELEAKLTREKSSTLWYKEHSRDLGEQLDGEKRSHAATKGQLTKTRKRVQNGVCPDCNRHFVNLERHMHTKHAETASE